MEQQTTNNADIMAELLALRAENERLRANRKSTGSIKISPKGGVSVYGLGRFPVTLYSSQWQALFEKQEDIKAFIVENLAILAQKGQDDAKN